MSLMDRSGKGILVTTATLQMWKHELFFLNFVFPLLDIYISVKFNSFTSVRLCKPAQQKSHKIRVSSNIQYDSNIKRC